MRGLRGRTGIARLAGSLKRPLAAKPAPPPAPVPGHWPAEGFHELDYPRGGARIKFNPNVKLDTSQITDLRDQTSPYDQAKLKMTPRPVPEAPRIDPRSFEQQRYFRQRARYEHVARSLGTSLRGDDDIRLDEVVRLQFLARAQGKSFFKLYNEVKN